MDNRHLALIGHTIHALRPEWDMKAIKAALESHSDRYNFEQLLLPAIRAAYDREILTPQGIFFMERPHWDNPQLGQAHDSRPCQDHPYFEAANCPPCRSEVKTGTRARTDIGKATYPQTPPAPRPANFHELVRQATRTTP